MLLTEHNHVFANQSLFLDYLKALKTHNADLPLSVKLANLHAKVNDIKPSIAVTIISDASGNELAWVKTSELSEILKMLYLGNVDLTEVKSMEMGYIIGVNHPYMTDMTESNPKYNLFAVTSNYYEVHLKFTY